MKTVRRPPYPKWNPGYFPCSSLIPLPLSSRRPSVSFGGFGLKDISVRDYLQDGEVLFNNTNSSAWVGKSVVFRKAVPAVCSNHVTRLQVRHDIQPEFVATVLNMLQERQFFAYLATNFNNQAGVNTTTLSNVRIPLPPASQREKLVSEIEAARAERKAKLAEADALLAGVDDFVLDALGLTQPPADPRRTFAVQKNELSGAINPGRYRGLQIEKHLSGLKAIVGDVGVLIKNKITPAKVAPNEEFDWIRIDDLTNQPWEVEQVRTVQGADVTGTFFEIQDNDLLIARLGPTIQNAKFVLCPSRSRRTIASTEFLVLRCSGEHLPEAVLWVLRMSLYREIMYLRSRGATPSRFRFTGDDLLSMPFRRINRDSQFLIAKEINRRRQEARRLQNEAEAGWQVAKQWFEGELLGGDARQ